MFPANQPLLLSLVILPYLQQDHPSRGDNEPDLSQLASDSQPQQHSEQQPPHQSQSQKSSAPIKACNIHFDQDTTLLPSISILKPLMGIDPNLPQNLETFFTMNYETVSCVHLFYACRSQCTSTRVSSRPCAASDSMFICRFSLSLLFNTVRASILRGKQHRPSHCTCGQP